MGITYACIQAAREYSAVVFNRIPLCPGTFTLAYSRTVATPGPAHTLSRERPTNRAAATARPRTASHAQAGNAHTAGAEAARAASTAAFVA